MLYNTRMYSNEGKFHFRYHSYVNLLWKPSYMGELVDMLANKILNFNVDQTQIFFLLFKRGYDRNTEADDDDDDDEKIHN